MLVAFHRVLFIGFVIIFTSVSTAHQYGSPTKTLYVADEGKRAGREVTVIDRVVDGEPSSDVVRKKRQAATLDSPGMAKNISTWATHLNDSHQQLMVHWVGEGSNVIICLARDSSPRNKGGLSPSALYISYDYGKNFTNKTESFRLGDSPNSGYAQLDKFFNHPRFPEFCVFVDSTNKKLFYTSDNGQTIHRSDLSFHPSELAFDEEFPDKYVILDKVNTNRTLYLTRDGGKTFKMIQSFVKTFIWSSGPGMEKVFYMERWKPDGTSTVFSAFDPTELVDAGVIFEDAKDFQVKGDFMFATKQSKERNTLHLYISHRRGPFYKAEFQTELDLRKFHIADVTDQRIFVSVMHTETLANLYVSEISNDFTEYNFVVSLEQILSYFPDGNWKDSWLEDVTEDSFTDLYRVEGIKGIYIASKVDGKVTSGSIGPEHLISVITFDHGVTWSPVSPPKEDENGKPLNCHIENSCSLHLCQKFSQLYPVTSAPGNSLNGLRSASIMSSKSAPGIIMATGVMGKSLKGIPGVYLSRDAGLTWRRILKDYYFFNYGDHGGVLVAVKYFKSRGETSRILYSTNEGIDWNSYQFNEDDLRIYGLMTEPGENTTTFTMFGSANDHHQWIIITIDLRNTFARNCTDDDYKFWSPSIPNEAVSCVLGARNLFQRRIAHTNCYHGVDFKRGSIKEICECTRRDFECDYGFMLSGHECVQNKTVKHDPYATPSDCSPGKLYNRTRGFRKIDGDVCTISGYIAYAPDEVPCPIDEPQEFMLVALRDKIARINLFDNTTIYPVTDQKDIVAIEFDLKNHCIYWADIELDQISRQCYNGKGREIVVDTDLTSIEGMALDWISNVLFFVDGLRKKIEAVRIDLSNEGRMRVTILDEKVLSKPRGITVHPKAGYLFWTDWDRFNPSVSRSNLDGTEVKRLFGKPIVQWPNGITIDYMAERIYWVDASEDYIASADLNGQYFKRILWEDGRVSHPFAVAVIKDKIYWDDWKEKSIFIADKDTGGGIITINDSFSGLMDLKVFAHFAQRGNNPCSYSNTSCDTMCLGGPGNTFTCLCPAGFKKVGDKCICPNGLEPYANMTCPKKPGGVCDSEEFTCKNGLCIRASWKCDENDDCGDGSDEVGCHCVRPMISCDNNRCYLPSWRCDGDMDCADMSDEQNCGHNCTANEFQCGNGLCIEKRWVCDGDNDCKDGSDEQNCTSVTRRPIINCTNGFSCGNQSLLCVPHNWVCDGERDCPAGEDEAENRCKNSTCAPYMFRCPSAKCIYKSWVCDGENDCGDVEASDEKNCTNVGHSKFLPNPNLSFRPNFHNNETCLDWMFKCENGNCLPDWWRCDGIDDCGDQSDEIGCGLYITRPKTEKPPEQNVTKISKCAKTQFTCAPGVCIPLSWVCDGAPDCDGGADERDCAVPPRPRGPCAPDQTPCADGTHCVNNNKLCDGVFDCVDKSDEALCPNKTKHKHIVNVCAPNQFSCDDESDCIPMSFVCDGEQNCWDSSDEANCTNVYNDNAMHKYLRIGVDQSSINSTSFLISCWMSQQKIDTNSFLPSIAKVSDGRWTNMSWTNDSIYRFTNLEPYTNYNVTVYIRDNINNKTFASDKYVNITTGEGVPSPPRRLTVRQLVGRRLNVVWDAPEFPRGNIHHYMLYQAPPIPPIKRIFVPVNDTMSVVLYSYFIPNVNYSFWIEASNNAYTSNETDISYLLFEESGDIDDINNVSMSRLNDTAVFIKWHKIPGVEGYTVEQRMPPYYGKREPVVTKYNNATITDLPPGCEMYIDIKAFKKSMYSDPFTIPLKTAGEALATIVPEHTLLAGRNAVRLVWDRPLGEIYVGKTLTYEVHYSNIIKRINPGELSNDTKILTTKNEIEIGNLNACEVYVFSVGLKGGPLARTPEVITRPTPTAAVKNLRVDYDAHQAQVGILWEAGCSAPFGPVTFRLELTEETKNKKSIYELKPTTSTNIEHVLQNVPVGARYNVCVHVAIPNAEVRCVKFRAQELDTPNGVVAWIGPNGYVLVSWQDHPEHMEKGIKYEVVVSEKEIPEDLLHPTDGMKTMVAESSPCLISSLSGAKGPLYVGVRTLNPEGYYSDLSEVHTLQMEGERAEANTVAASSALYWGAAGAVIVGVALGAALLIMAVRHRRLTRSFLRFTAHTPRYDNRRGQATIGEHDDDDVPPIHGFSDDEPLVIA